MTESPGTAALDELEVVRAELTDRIAIDPDATVDEPLLQRSERAIVDAVAALAANREEAAPAREAAVAGALPRRELPLVRDLLITVDLMRNGLAP